MEHKLNARSLQGVIKANCPSPLMWIAFLPRIRFAFVNQDAFAIIACYAAKRSLNSHILSVILTAIAGVTAE